MANVPSENSLAVNANNQQRPDQNPASAGPSGASGVVEGVNGGDDGGHPFRYISPAAQNTFQYLRKSSASGGGREVEDRWTPFVFQLIPPEDNNSNVEKSELFKNIRLAGGTTYSGEDVEGDVNGVIRILNEDYYNDNEGKDCIVPLDTYSSMFVYRCISKRNQGLSMPDPSKYLIPSSASKYVSYDARRILQREQDWEDIDKLVFPPNHKRISAQQWVEELRKLKSKAMESPQNHPDAQKSFNGPTTTTRTKVDDPNEHVRQVKDFELGNASNNNTQRQPRKRSREPDEDESRTLAPSPKRRDVPLVATTLSPSLPSSSNGLQESGNHELEPVAGPSRLNYASSAPKPRRLSGSSASTSSREDSQRSTDGIEKRAQLPPAPRASAAKPTTSSKPIGQSPPSRRPAAVSESPSLPVSCSSKTNGKLATTCRQPFTSSALPSTSTVSKNVTVISRKQIPMKPLPYKGPSRSGRGITKQKPRPVRDDGFIDVSNDGFSDDSVHFSDNPDVDVQPELRPSRRRREYSTEESQRILDLVCALDAYRYVKCYKFWKQVSKKIKRTFLSLDNHFRKIIFVKVTSDKKHLASIYKISTENLMKLKKGWNNKVNKHQTKCPDYKM